MPGCYDPRDDAIHLQHRSCPSICRKRRDPNDEFKINLRSSRLSWGQHRHATQKWSCQLLHHQLPCRSRLQKFGAQTVNTKTIRNFILAYGAVIGHHQKLSKATTETPPLTLWVTSHHCNGRSWKCTSGSMSECKLGLWCKCCSGGSKHHHCRWFERNSLHCFVSEYAKGINEQMVVF